jgi:hypothetical protein
MYSFRKSTFVFFIGLFTKVKNMFLNKLYVALNCMRVRFIAFLYELFNMFTLNSRSEANMGLNLHHTFDYYFNAFVCSPSVYSNTHTRGLFVRHGYQGILFYLFLNYLQLLLSFFHSCNLVMFPKTSKLFTVLRSPHTDKKSREQFNLTTFRGTIKDVSCCIKIILQYVPSILFSSLFVRIRELEHNYI